MNYILNNKFLTVFLVPFLLGHKPDKAGLSIFSIILSLSLDITKRAPVLPADIIMSDVFFFTLSIALCLNSAVFRDSDFILK